jgi:hypothetical protein
MRIRADRAAQLPERTPPVGFTPINGASGGRTLAGTFTGNARSAAAVLGAMLGGLRGYFDGAPAVSRAVGDPRDRSIMAFFDARLQDPPHAVVNSDPTKFRLVPPSQYRTTD